MTFNLVKYCILTLLLFVSLHLEAQKKTIENYINDSLTIVANTYASVGKVNISAIVIDKEKKTITVTVSDILSQIPFRPDNVRKIYTILTNNLGKKNPGYTFFCITNERNIEDLIPNIYRIENQDKRKQFVISEKINPLITKLSIPYIINNGLQNRHLAIWQSHGWYYNQKLARWEWQRPRLFQTVEDLYTQSYVMPYLVPMLENAGANVLVPRERDTQLNEVIVDNDNVNPTSHYREISDRKNWKSGDEGFANIKERYLQFENPFRSGTYRAAQTITENDETSSIEWIPRIPDEGYYAVYISYKSVLNSTTDAHYKVYYKGGAAEFNINQSINGGTWVYLGHFKFEKGRKNQFKVVLTNFSKSAGRIVTADAVKFGGGMGNIARKPNDLILAEKNKIIDSLAIYNEQVKEPLSFESEISTYPRYTEGARYWLQWAGIPDSIFSKSKGENDYTDDFNSRGNWVNYLAGGSSVAPNLKGLGIPIDMAVAFHTDAGIHPNDSTIGTLGICTVQNSIGISEFSNGISRWASRDLTDIIQTQIVNDIRRKYDSEWTRRGIWNKSYSEARVPEVPTMLLELLSHQNFADMRYGLDPRFRFTVSRSIYKGILKYLSFNSEKSYTVLPLAVEQFSMKFISKTKLELRWKSVIDSLEPTAVAKQFIIYTRINDGGFNNGFITKNNRVIIEIQPGKIYSFKIGALNEGGESFPSEILSVYRSPNERGEVLIINGFDRISGPVSFTSNHSSAGFLNDDDAGVPYIMDISFVGKQYEFQRNKIFKSNDSPGFGASSANFETTVIAGNTFDFPYIHGKAIKEAGFSFVSCSHKAVTKGDIILNDFKFVDLILGKQKQTFIGNEKKIPEFKTFPLALQQALRNYCQQAGNLMVSGAYIASDMYVDNYANTDERMFLENVLKIKLQSAKASIGGGIKMISSPFINFNKSDFSYSYQPNSTIYAVESPDAIEPSAQGGFTICKYNEGNLSAGVAYTGNYKTCCFGFPFETIINEKERNKLMESILSFFSKNTKGSIY